LTDLIEEVKTRSMSKEELLYALSFIEDTLRQYQKEAYPKEDDDE